MIITAETITILSYRSGSECTMFYDTTHKVCKVKLCRLSSLTFRNGLEL